ncbi:hypothetical protein K440DRAFT_37042 [Wilcoxina mikolae CBS 423.85]|nr:hypothetical protein K440DRAFT_37042 [Wilcoxina mikolae CBS 423.85]
MPSACCIYASVTACCSHTHTHTHTHSVDSLEVLSLSPQYTPIDTRFLPYSNSFRTKILVVLPPWTSVLFKEQQNPKVDKDQHIRRLHQVDVPHRVLYWLLWFGRWQLRTVILLSDSNC